MSNVTTLLVGLILAVMMIVAGYGVFQATADGADDSLFNGDDSLFGKAKNIDETGSRGDTKLLYGEVDDAWLI